MQIACDRWLMSRANGVSGRVDRGARTSMTNRCGAPVLHLLLPTARPASVASTAMGRSSFLWRRCAAGNAVDLPRGAFTASRRTPRPTPNHTRTGSRWLSGPVLEPSEPVALSTCHRCAFAVIAPGPAGRPDVAGAAGRIGLEGGLVRSVPNPGRSQTVDHPRACQLSRIQARGVLRTHQAAGGRQDHRRPGRRHHCGVSGDRTERYIKNEFPTHQVYGTIDHAGLRLTTCGGEIDLDKGSYENNIVTYAIRESSHLTE